MVKIPRDIHEDSAPFNMALATLERLHKILIKLTEISTNDYISREDKQHQRLSLLKEFYINSCPLLKEESVKKFVYILDLKPVMQKVIENIGGTASNVKGYTIKYDGELETQINKALVSIQIDLQKEKYFMPPKSDPKIGWKMD